MLIKLFSKKKKVIEKATTKTKRCSGEKDVVAPVRHLHVVSSVHVLGDRPAQEMQKATVI